MSIQGNINQILGNLGITAGITKRVHQESPETKLKEQGTAAREKYQKDIAGIKDIGSQLGITRDERGKLQRMGKTPSMTSTQRDLLKNRFISHVKGIRDVEIGKDVSPIYKDYISDISFNPTDLNYYEEQVGRALDKVVPIETQKEEMLKKAEESLASQAKLKLEQARKSAEFRKKVLEGTPSEYLLGGK